MNRSIVLEYRAHNSSVTFRREADGRYRALPMGSMTFPAFEEHIFAGQPEVYTPLYASAPATCRSLKEIPDET